MVNSTLLSRILLSHLKHNKSPANTDVYRTFQAPRVGLEPTTLRLTAECSAIELSRKKEENKNIHPQNPIRKEKEGNKEKVKDSTN